MVGNSPTPEVLALGGDEVVVVGYAPSLTPYLETSLVSVAPLRFGSGMKGKISQAMAFGLPVVTTTVGAEGMSLESGDDVLVADDAAGLAECIVRLHEDNELWQRISDNGRRRVVESWTRDRARERLLKLFSDL